MNIDDLLKGLNHNRPAVRLKTIEMIILLEEVDALPSLAQLYRKETVPAIKQLIQVAGPALRAAQDAGYSTLDGLCIHFGIDRQIDNMVSESEKMVMRTMNTGGPDAGKAGRNAAMRAVGGGIMLGAAGMVTGATGAGVFSDSDRPAYDPRAMRDMPTAPGQDDISEQIAVLNNSKDNNQLASAILQLGGKNNPAALPHIAGVYMQSKSRDLRETAQRIGKRIYWNAIYWQMEQDGLIEDIIRQRAIAAGKIEAEEGQEPAPKPAPKKAAAPKKSGVKLGELIAQAREEEGDNG